MNYSKKQIQPLIDKFKINAETNTVFNRIIELFNEQTNYQVWAIKAVFGRLLSIDDLEMIASWANENQTLIKLLIKKNIVSYTSKTDMTDLMLEIRGLNMIAAVKNTISKFNTAQRDMLKEVVFKNELNGLIAAMHKTFGGWYDLLSKFEMLPEHRKKAVIVSSSALSDFGMLKQAIKDALLASYEWTKDDLIRYIQCNAKDCNVIFNRNNVIVVEVNSFESSKKLGGNSRTSWCITRESKFFKQYVIDVADTKQYFLFDFNKSDSDELAYIGFTVTGNKGITYAHSKNNHNMVNEGISYKNDRVNIQKALKMSGVNLGCFMKLKNLTRFSWNIESFLEFLSKNTENIALVRSENNRVIVRILTNNGLSALLEHSFVDRNQFTVSNNDNKIYLIFDFNLPINDDKSLIIMSYVKDQYKIDTLHKMFDVYGTNIIKDGYLSNIGVSTESFLNREQIDPKILLHKLIDEKNEKEAIELINKQGDEFDVNFEFNQVTPIFKAQDGRMFELFKVLINHKNFDRNAENTLGETLLQSLLYSYLSETEEKQEKVENELKKMITIVIESDNFDYNIQDINLDTALTISCTSNVFNWIIPMLLAKESVDINIVNDENRTALTEAIRNKNTEAIKMLSTHPNFIVRKEDYELASNQNINIDALIGEGKQTTSKTTSTSSSYDEVYAHVFSRLRK